MSGFVLPEHMPVAEHEDMASRDELIDRVLERLIAVVELQARALSQQSLEREHIVHLPNGVLRRLNDDPTVLREFYDQAIGTYKPPTPKRPGHRPNEKAMREWATFRDKYQKLEREIRRELHLADEDEVTREMMYVNGGEHPRTMTNHMLWHGLRADQWPTATWPEEAPDQQV